MSSNGFPRGGRSGRTPHFLTIGLLIVICILAFNYWNVSSQNKILQKESTQMRGNLEELALRRVHLEKRAEALSSQLKQNNEQLKETNGRENTCQSSLREVGMERDTLREKINERQMEIKELQTILEDSNDTISQQKEELDDLKEELKTTEEELREKDFQVVDLRKNLQHTAEQLTFANVEIKSCKAEVEALTQEQHQQQEQQQQQQALLHPAGDALQQTGALDPRQAVNHLTSGQQQQAGQIYNPQQQIEYQKQVQQSNYRIPNVQPGGGVPAMGSPQGQLSMQNRLPLPNLGLVVPDVPKVEVKIPEFKKGLGDAGDGLATRLGDEKSEDKRIFDDRVEKVKVPQDGVVAGKAVTDNLNSPEEEKKSVDKDESLDRQNFIGEGGRNDGEMHIVDGNAIPLINAQEDDSEPLGDHGGVSNLESASQKGSSRLDLKNGIEDQQSPGREGHLKFIGRKDRLGGAIHRTEDGSLLDENDYHKDGQREEVIQGQLENPRDSNGGDGFQLDRGPVEDAAGSNVQEDDDRLRFEPVDAIHKLPNPFEH